VLHDTYTDAMICNSSRGEKFESSTPLQEYSWRIRILSLLDSARLEDTRRFSGGFTLGSYPVTSPLAHLPARTVFEVPQPEVVPYEYESLLYCHPLSSQPVVYRKECFGA
jgi:hypothetical protein